MGMLIEGRWCDRSYTADEKGRFLRDKTRFRQWVQADGSTPFAPAAGRYHLYVSWACPWAHRTLIMRQLKGLEQVISLSVVDDVWGEQGWRFSHQAGFIPDTVNGAQYLWEIYVKADPGYTGRVTVPILWDRQTGTIVNNESAEIMRMLDTEFHELGHGGVSYYPAALRQATDCSIKALYEPINNGVYRAGFAATQAAYEEAVTELFNALDHWEQLLGSQRYLCGASPTEADWCLFTTLLRFDAVYYVHFKCNLRHIYEYPNLWNYLKELYQMPGVAETCYLDHIKNHYYRSHPFLNPKGIVPKGPELDLSQPHNRD